MISPWVIYWIDVLGTVGSVACFLMWTIGFITLILIGNCIVDAFGEDSKVEQETLARQVKCTKWFAIITLTLLALVCLIPSKETMYTMLVVDQLTPENIEAMRDFGVETVQQLGDAIASSINKIEVK